MALVPHCDRCDQPGQLIPVLGKDICNGCVDAVRSFLATPPRAPRRLTRLEQATDVCRARGRVEARLLAATTGEHYRTVYYGLINEAKRGRLVHLGRGVFELPRAEAAE